VGGPLMSNVAIMTKSEAGHAARVCLPFASPGLYAGMRAEPFAPRASKIWTCARCSSHTTTMPRPVSPLSLEHMGRCPVVQPVVQSCAVRG
jgi:hypothetical protein